MVAAPPSQDGREVLASDVWRRRPSGRYQEGTRGSRRSPRLREGTIRYRDGFVTYADLEYAFAAPLRELSGGVAVTDTGLEVRVNGETYLLEFSGPRDPPEHVWGIPHPLFGIPVIGLGLAAIEGVHLLNEFRRAALSAGHKGSKRRITAAETDAERWANLISIPIELLPTRCTLAEKPEYAQLFELVSQLDRALSDPLTVNFEALCVPDVKLWFNNSVFRRPVDGRAAVAAVISQIISKEGGRFNCWGGNWVELIHKEWTTDHRGLSHRLEHEAARIIATLQFEGDRYPEVCEVICSLTDPHVDPRIFFLYLRVSRSAWRRVKNQLALPAESASS